MEESKRPVEASKKSKKKKGGPKEEEKKPDKQIAEQIQYWFDHSRQEDQEAKEQRDIQTERAQ